MLYKFKVYVYNDDKLVSVRYGNIDWFATSFHDFVLSVNDTLLNGGSEPVPEEWTHIITNFVADTKLCYKKDFQSLLKMIDNGSIIDDITFEKFFV